MRRLRAQAGCRGGGARTAFTGGTAFLRRVPIIRSPSFLLALLIGLPGIAHAQGEDPAPALARVLAESHAQRWDTLAIGETVARFGRAFEGTPYREGTLEGPGPERCRVTTDGFDCVTFMETALDLARAAHAAAGAEPTADGVVRAVTETRYRGGRLAGYASRLHYFSDWIADNVARGAVEDVTPSLGGVPFPVRVRYMSEHPGLYPALRDSRALTDSMRAIEGRLRGTRRYHVPRDRVAAIESKLRTGDLIAITTSIPGLDYAHTGLIVREGGRARFLHASSTRKRVVLDEGLGAYLARQARTDLGITVLRARPVPPDP